MNKQTQRIVRDGELNKSSMGDVETYVFGRIYFHHNLASSPAYSDGKLLGIQPVVLKRFLLSLFITINKKPHWKVIGRTGFGVANSPGIIGPGA